MSNRTFEIKVRLTPDEAKKLKDRAYDQQVSKADYIRLLVFGPNSCERLPSAPVLRDISLKLAGIGNNLNHAQRAINAAKQAGTLNTKQFVALYRAIEIGHRNWTEPLKMLRRQLAQMKASKSS